MTDQPQRRFLVLAPAEAHIPIGAPPFDQWELEVRDVADLFEAQEIEGNWDVVAFYADAFRPDPPEETLDAIRRVAPEATFLAITSSPEITEAIRYLKGGIYEYLPLPIEASALANSVSNALENRDAYREILEMTELLMEEKTELERKNRELEAISMVAQAVSRSLELDDILAQLVDCIKRTFSFDRISIGLVNRSRLVEETRLSAGHVEGETAGIAWALDRADTAPWIRTVFQEGKTLHVDDPATDPLIRGTLLAQTHSGPLAKVPLAARGNIVGSVTVDNHRSRTLISPEEVRILQIIADTASMAVENSRLYMVMRDLSVRDELTGLYNRRHLHERADADIANASRHNLPVSLLLLDLDHFKQLNDLNDHLVGDAALKKVAQVLQDSTRGIDTVARFGGEEMVIVLPQTGTEGAQRVGEKLRAAIETTSFRGEKLLPGGKLTVSVGIATYPRDGGTFKELLECADKAMYRAKRNGRNRVELIEGQCEEKPVQDFTEKRRK